MKFSGLRVLAVIFLAALSFGVSATSAADSDDEFSTKAPLILVANAKLDDAANSRTVLLAVPGKNGMHFGLILNRPGDITLAEMFPDHAPSKLVTEPLYLGG